MLVYVWKDEAYPVYGVDTDPLLHREKMVEIPDELYEEYVRAKKEYREVQEELGKYSCE